jgi:hypothetical protein
LFPRPSQIYLSEGKGNKKTACNARFSSFNTFGPGLTDEGGNSRSEYTNP